MMHHPDLTVEQAIRIWAVEAVVAWGDGPVRPSAAKLVDFVLNGLQVVESSRGNAHGLAGSDPLPVDGISNLADEVKDSTLVQSVSSSGAEQSVEVKDHTLSRRCYAWVDGRDIVVHEETPVSGLDAETVAELPVGENTTGGEG